MTNPPIFSVVIPTYNRPAYLKEAIESVFRQTFQDFEVIIVDDSPEASSRSVVNPFEDKRLSYIVNDHNRGGAGTRNAGISRAKGKWVAFLDDDDVWLPTKLEQQFQQIKSLDSEVGLIYTGHKKCDKELNEISTFMPEHEGWLYNTLLSENVIKGLYSVAIRREILEEIGGLDERFPALQDMDLYVRVAKRYRVASLAAPLVLVRASGDGRITTNYTSKLRGSLLFWEKFKSDIDKDIHLRHRAASRVFMFAFAEGNVGQLVKSTPLTLAGLALDLNSVRYVARFVAKTSYEQLRRAV